MKRLSATAIAVGAAWLPALAQADAPMNYLQAYGPKAHEIKNLTWALLILSIVVIAVTSGAVLIGIARRRVRNPNAEVAFQPLEVAGSGLAWIYIGTGLSTVALFGAMVWTGHTMAAIHWPPAKPAMTVEITGQQWWWRVVYADPDVSKRFETANEIHIPVGEPVEFKVQTTDVIHSFWVPPLGDKIDLIPNQTNYTWFEASEPGTYRGQCAEFCGKQHAHMALLVLADKPDDFKRWRDAQVEAASPGTQTATGEALFVVRCGACHTVRGTRAGGRLGPDLTHLMARETLAAATLPNRIAYLSGWIADPQRIKPGNLMPTLDLSGPELEKIRDFLETLK